MHVRATALIERLGLQPHPEGGFYRQVYKSGSIVNGTRSAITAIYFLLPRNQHSRWHRVTSDEVWTNIEGDGVALHTFDGTSVRTQSVGQALPFAVVEGGVWQAAEPLGEYALVACFVAPGFEFEDFTMMSQDADAAARLASVSPEMTRLV